MKSLFSFFILLLAGAAVSQTPDQTDVLAQMDRLEKMAQIALDEKDPDRSISYCDTAINLATAQALEATPAFGRISLIMGKAYFKKVNYAEAEKWLLQATRVFEKAELTDDPYYVKCLFSLGILKKTLGKLGEAEGYYLKVLKTYEKSTGKTTTDYASTANNLAIVYAQMGDFAKAESFFLEANTIWKKILTIQDPGYYDYIGSIVNLAAINWHLVKYEKAELLFLESKDIFEQKLQQSDHPFYTNCLHGLANLYRDMGYYEKAELLFLQSIAIAEKLIGKEHPEYAIRLENLASIYWAMGNYEKAELFDLESKAVREKVLGKEHPHYAGSLSNLASLYIELGNYEKAEPLCLEAKEIKIKTLGKEHPDYAKGLNLLGVLYKYMGNYDKSEPLHLEAKDIYEKTLGKEHPSYASTLNDLAILYWTMGKYEKAEPLYLEATEINKKTIGKEHPDYATSLNNLASLYNNMGNYEKAEPLYLEAKAIWEKTFGKEHPTNVISLINQASLYLRMGNYKKADPLCLEAIALSEKALGKQHPDYVLVLNNLAQSYEKQTRFNETDPVLKEVLMLNQLRMANATTFLSEQELAKYALTFQNSGDQLRPFLLARHAREANPGILPLLAYDHALFYKGFLLMAASKLNAPLDASNELKEIKRHLKGYRRRLAAEYSKPIAERIDIAELEQKANEAEKALARSVAGYADNLRQVSWEEVKAVLKQSEAAIEFVHFKVNFPSKTDSNMYAALLLRPGIAQPLFIPLFEEKELDHLLNADKERKADYVNELYAWADRGMVQLGSAKKPLYDLIWAKINEAGLEGIETIYYSPSGVLHRLNLGAIAINDEAILSDRYNLVALNSTRQLVIPSAVNTPANDALLVGGVNFEVETILPALDDQPLLASRSASEVLVSSGTRGGTWSYLKWTEKEVERIVATIAPVGYQVDTLYGSNADEETIKAIGLGKSSPRVLHIATHGFFFPDPEAKKQEIGLDGAEPVFKSSDNPMIRSGLILAGGNYAWQHGRAVSPDKEDGILTAYEISQMNLANTELVVLSACETGLGDIQGNEGVYGLQRAFKIAGAKYLIMSLWQVPDRETMEFMTTFYKNWLEEKLTIPDAFRKTQREMRDRFFNPYSWAGFVLVE
jgi:CHAT domain-containing protein/tetratricopeptide (TPR) repeat protein